MKNFQSTVENAWIELVIVPLTQEQRVLMQSTNPEDAIAKLALRETIKSAREVAVSPEKVTALNAFYTTKKPALLEGDTYQLISVNITEKVENVFTGIINCRVNGEHKQPRF